MRRLLALMLQAQGFDVVEAADGVEAVAAAQRHSPDVVLMDLQLPGMSGLEAIAEILRTAPVPIVVLSGALGAPDGHRTFEALQAGAVEVIAKPTDDASRRLLPDRLGRTLRLMAQVPMVLREETGAASLPAPLQGEAAPPSLAACSLLVVGAASGGPPVLFGMLRAIPVPSPVPIVLAQQVSPEFGDGLAAWLTATGHPVELLAESSSLEPGRVVLLPPDRAASFVGPGELQLGPGGGPLLDLDALLGSMAEHGGGAACGVLLSGPGEGGARGLLALRDAGGTTACQTAASSVVPDMPRAAEAMGAAGYVASAKDLCGWIGSELSAKSGLHRGRLGRPGQLRVLVVEDSGTQRGLLRARLTEAGMQVETAANGVEGLHAARARAFDVVVSDVHMPEMEGPELCRHLRADPERAHIPVVLLTGSGATAERDAQDSGANAWLHKPYRLADLLATLEGLVAP